MPPPIHIFNSYKILFFFFFSVILLFTIIIKHLFKNFKAPSKNLVLHPPLDSVNQKKKNGLELTTSSSLYPTTYVFKKKMLNAYFSVVFSFDFHTFFGDFGG